MHIANSFGYNWYLWRLYHKVTFDGANRIIYVNDGVTDLEIKSEVYSAWKEWTSSTPDNATWPPAIRTVGGDPTVGDQKAGDIYFLQNNWKLYIDITKVKVTGALFSDNFTTAYHDLTGVPIFPAEVASLVTTQTVESSEASANIVASSVWSNSSATDLIAKVLELWQLSGLDASNSVTITDTSISFGNLTVSIAQPDIDSTTLTRT